MYLYLEAWQIPQEGEKSTLTQREPGRGPHLVCQPNCSHCKSFPPQRCIYFALFPHNFGNIFKLLPTKWMWLHPCWCLHNHPLYSYSFLKNISTVIAPLFFCTDILYCILFGSCFKCSILCIFLKKWSNSVAHHLDCESGLIISNNCSVYSDILWHSILLSSLILFFYILLLTF